MKQTNNIILEVEAVNLTTNTITALETVTETKLDFICKDSVQTKCLHEMLEYSELLSKVTHKNFNLYVIKDKQKSKVIDIHVDTIIREDWKV